MCMAAFRRADDHDDDDITLRILVAHFPQTLPVVTNKAKTNSDGRKNNYQHK